MDTLTDVGTLDKAMAVVRAVEDEPADLATLVGRTGFTRATAHRLATALVQHGLLRREGNRFAPGFEWFRLGRKVADTVPLAQRGRPVLEDLRRRTGESVQLYVRDGDRRICVAALDSPQELRTIVAVGAALPLDRGSAGVVLSAAAPDPNRPVVSSIAERAPGVASVSAAVTGATGATVAAVSVSGPVERMGPSPAERFGGDVAWAARELSALA
jgi:DNA-binding IclR family transcriptional regulator